ncbi:MAG: hypothetical protein LiPW15_238 [Parcubacteria group bacterium LiPW_15]|nr:MAG: hypothetical protein LiPW15_238 [Parcubacteria group bacterium LiPW_15]
MNRRRKVHGLTLIEVLVIICILGIIAALASDVFLEEGSGQAVGRIVSVQTTTSGEYRITLASGSTAGFNWSRDLHTKNRALAEEAKSYMLQQKIVLVEFKQTALPICRITNLKLLKE